MELLYPHACLFQLYGLLPWGPSQNSIILWLRAVGGLPWSLTSPKVSEVMRPPYSDLRVLEMTQTHLISPMTNWGLRRQLVHCRSRARPQNSWPQLLFSLHKTKGWEESWGGRRHTWRLQNSTVLGEKNSKSRRTLKAHGFRIGGQFLLWRRQVLTCCR